MNEKPCKILLVEDDLEEIAMFAEALAEIEEGLYVHQWMRSCEFVPVDRVAEAVEMLRSEPFDAVLLDTSLPDANGVEPFLRVHRTRPELPVLVLTEDDDSPLAISLVRQGAQDVLIKGELDCSRLSRALGCAIERQRVHNALRTLTMRDELTGVYSWEGFQALAEVHLQLAMKTGSAARLYVVEMEGHGPLEKSFGHQDADMAALLVAESMRDLFSETDLMGRRSPSSFVAIAVPEFTDRSTDLSERISARLERAKLPDTLAPHVRSAALSHFDRQDLATMLEAATSGVWENKRSIAQIAG